MVKSSSPIFQQVRLVLSGSHWSCIRLEHNSSLRRKCGTGSFQLYDYLLLLTIYLQKKNVKAEFSMEDTHQITKLKEPMPMSQLLWSVQLRMQLTYCCDTSKLVRVGCTIGSILRPNQIKSRSSMFLLLCLGLRPHWCILRKRHFTAFQLDLLYPVCILYILCSYAHSAIFFLPQRRLCLCYSGVQNMQQSESLQEFISKPGRIMILEQTWPCGLQLSWKMRASIQSTRDCARLNSWPECSCFFFPVFLRCPGALVSPWFRDKGRGPHPGHLVSKSMRWVLRDVEVRNPDLKSSHNFAWFVGPMCYASWVYVENGGTSCLWLPTSEWHFEPRLKSIDGTLVGELVVNGSRRTDALHPEQSETRRKTWHALDHWDALASPGLPCPSTPITPLASLGLPVER